jgi:hypothetical protein
MTAREVLTNIEHYDLWEFYDYKLPEREAGVVMEALRRMAEQEESEQGTRGGGAVG